MKNFRKKIIILSAIFLLLPFSFPGDVSAGGVSFSQAILPVRFVYLEKNDIEKIFNTVTSLDSAYVVKFISESNKKEISPTAKNLSDYQSYICRRNFEFSGLNESLSRFSKDKTDFVDFEINFVQNNNQLEEIRTLV